MKPYNPEDIVISFGGKEEYKVVDCSLVLVNDKTKIKPIKGIKGIKVKQIINLSGKKLTCEQIEDGAMELSDKDHATLTKLLTFEELPSRADLGYIASEITKLAQGFQYANISGIPAFLISQLEIDLLGHCIKPVHSFTTVKEVDVNMNGMIESYTKKFHSGWVYTW